MTRNKIHPAHRTGKFARLKIRLKEAEEANRLITQRLKTSQTTADIERAKADGYYTLLCNLNNQIERLQNILGNSIDRQTELSKELADVRKIRNIALSYISTTRNEDDFINYLGFAVTPEFLRNVEATAKRLADLYNSQMQINREMEAMNRYKAKKGGNDD